MEKLETKSIIVVTASDTGYFRWACDLLTSVRIAEPEIPFGVMDVGLDDHQIEWFKKQGAEVVPAKWEFNCQMPSGLPRTHLAMLSRPFLPNYFEDYSKILYIDADAWVQIPTAIAELAEASEGVDVALIPELDTAYFQLYQPHTPLRNMHRSAYVSVYGCSPPPPADGAVLNSGVLAAGRDSNMWKAWRDVLSEKVIDRLQRKGENGWPLLSERSLENFFLEQNALNFGCYSGKYSMRPMSAVYNWVCGHAMPLYDPGTGLLTVPVPPYEPIRIVHMTAEGRRATSLFDRRGRLHNRTLFYSGTSAELVTTCNE